MRFFHIEISISSDLDIESPKKKNSLNELFIADSIVFFVKYRILKDFEPYSSRIGGLEAPKIPFLSLLPYFKYEVAEYSIKLFQFQTISDMRIIKSWLTIWNNFNLYAYKNNIKKT